MKRGRFKHWRIVTVSTGIVGALAFSASPASAHNFKAWATSQDGVNRGYAEVTNNHTAFAVCDTKADGIGVYGRMQLQNGSIVDVVDPNGSASGCGFANTSSGNPIVKIEAVWRGGATSGWRDA
jgi:hypothetical protein